MLELDHVFLGYGGPPVIQGVSACLQANEIVGLLGVNGAGKTTLLHGIMGFLPLLGGRVILDGVDIGRLPSYEISQRGIALVPQGRRIFKSLTVRENLTLARQSNARSQWNLEAVLEFFPVLRERFAHGGYQLSGGEQQMLAWARALLTNPSMILMDEPTEGLAPRFVRMLKELMPRLKTEGHGILLAEQNIEFTCDVADRLLVIVNGIIKRELSREELIKEGIRGENAIAKLAAAVQGLD